jgi:methionine synthase II (cobalamin-independent)
VTVTGVGSLPHTDPEEAASFVTATTDVPYLPQLPRRHPAEGMLAQWGDGLAGAASDGFALRPGRPASSRTDAFGGAAAMLDRVPAETPEIKTQATGPVTLAAALLAGGHEPARVWDTVVDGLVERVAAHLAWIRASLPGAQVVLAFDEPALGALGEPAFAITVPEAEVALQEVLDATDAVTGVHCCDDTDWAMVGRLRPDFVSCDVGALGPGFGAGVGELAEAVADGTWFMWGVVPASVPPLPSGDDLMSRYRRAEGALILAGAPAQRLVRSAWFSPACGLAGLGEEQARVVADSVRAIAGGVRVDG